jgi:uncharacterized protein YndB with AHSA1/START domain
MTTTSAPAITTHGQFTLVHDYDASPARVFAAWSDPELKARWFVGPENWAPVERRCDFRVGGEELLHGRFPGGNDTVFSARYHLIEADARLVYVYDMRLGGRHHSVSLATVEFAPKADGTQLRFTEQVVFVDGTNGDDGTASRKRGTDAHLVRIAGVVADAGTR